MDRYHHRRPIDQRFYEQLATQADAIFNRDRSRGTASSTLPPQGMVLDCDRGDLLEIQMLSGPQVVLLYAWNPADPDERIWCQETSGLEDCFLRPFSRLWSTMARFRVLLTLLVDTVPKPAGGALGRHHFVLDGWESAAVWKAGGGNPSVATAEKRFASLLAGQGVDPNLHRDHVALFRKVMVQPDTQRIDVMRSDARRGDRVVLYVETKLRVALVPSPYRGGGSSPSSLDGTIEPVEVTITRSGIEPLEWPYAGIQYPDLSPYADPIGARLP